MDKEELNNVVCECVSDYEILNSAYDYIEKLENENKKLKVQLKEQKKFKENWKKLKKWIGKKTDFGFEKVNVEDIEIKMYKLERGDSNG